WNGSHEGDAAAHFALVAHSAITMATLLATKIQRLTISGRRWRFISSGTTSNAATAIEKSGGHSGMAGKRRPMTISSGQPTHASSNETAAPCQAARSRRSGSGAERALEDVDPGGFFDDFDIAQPASLLDERVISGVPGQKEDFTGEARGP